jgi:hypothetical protein
VPTHHLCKKGLGICKARVIRRGLSGLTRPPALLQGDTSSSALTREKMGKTMYIRPRTRHDEVESQTGQTKEKRK